MIALAGKGAFLAKTDIRSAFRLLPVSRGDFDLLGFRFQGKYYFDKMLPFGSSVSCVLFDKFASFLHWLTQRYSQNNFIIHYLDDFLFCGSSYSSNCHHSLQVFRTICSDIGVPIAYEKKVEPTHVLTFLGSELDSKNMTMRLPTEKLNLLNSTLANFLQAKKVSLRETQSLFGLLNFACKVVAPGRAFCRRLINSTIGLTKHYFRIRITKNIKADFRIWQEFLKSYNSISVISFQPWVHNNTIELLTDSAGDKMGALVYTLKGNGHMGPGLPLGQNKALLGI